VAASSRPCRAIGGDFFDYFTLPDGAFAFVVADVAGKGPPAALLASMLQGIFTANAHRGDTPAITIREANDALMRRAIEARFVTTVYGVLGEDGRLTYCNAGHNPPLLIGTPAPCGVFDRGLDDWVPIASELLGALLCVVEVDVGSVGWTGMVLPGGGGGLLVGGPGGALGLSACAGVMETT